MPWPGPVQAGPGHHSPVADMRYLFVCSRSPGNLGAIASWLARQDEVIFASGRERREYAIAGVRRVILKKPDNKKTDKNDYLDLWQDALRVSRSTNMTLGSVRDSGYDPDIIISSSANGSAFSLRELFPSALHVNFLEYESPALKSGRGPAMRYALQSLQAMQAHLAFSFFKPEPFLFGQEVCRKIRPDPLAVDTDFFSPCCGPGFSCWKFSSPQELLAFNLQDASLDQTGKAWETAALLLQKRPQSHIAMLLPNSFFMRGILERLESLPKDLQARLYPEIFLEHVEYRNLLASSRLVITPYARTDARGNLEAMSCASVLVAPKACDSFFRHGDNMLALPDENPRHQSDIIAEWLDGAGVLKEMGRRARNDVENEFCLQKVIPPFMQKITSAWAKLCDGRQQTEKP